MKGCAVMWSNVLETGTEDLRLLHQALPPKTGIKYGVNCFFNVCSRTELEVANAGLAPCMPLLNTANITDMKRINAWTLAEEVAQPEFDELTGLPKDRPIAR
jgi:hypothetical protein